MLFKCLTQEAFKNDTPGVWPEWQIVVQDMCLRNKSLTERPPLMVQHEGGFSLNNLVVCNVLREPPCHRSCRFQQASKPCPTLTLQCLTVSPWSLYMFLFSIPSIEQRQANRSGSLHEQTYHSTENYYTNNSETIMDVNNDIHFPITNSQTIVQALGK